MCWSIYKFAMQMSPSPGVEQMHDQLSRQRCMQSLKAALDETIAALAKQPDLAGVLWERMLASVIVQPLRDDTRMVSLARYDISYQLNEVEVSILHSSWMVGRHVAYQNTFYNLKGLGQADPPGI